VGAVVFIREVSQTGGTNGKVESGWRAVPSAEVVMEGEKKCKRAEIVRAVVMA
jgi:hypothetical protein